MRPSKIFAVAGTTFPMLLAACSVPTTERPPNEEPAPADNGGESKETAKRPPPVETPPSSSSSSVASAPAQSNEEVIKVPEDVLRTPAELMMLMQQVRAQIVYKTIAIPESHYEAVIRPSLVRQLRAAGFAQDDVEQILSDVDYSRGLQGLGSPPMQAESEPSKTDAR